MPGSPGGGGAKGQKVGHLETHLRHHCIASESLVTVCDSRGNQEVADLGPEVHLVPLVLLVLEVQVDLEQETKCVLTCTTFVCCSIQHHN